MLKKISSIFSAILLESWEMFDEASLYILLGLLLAGLIQVFIPKERIIKYLGGRDIKSVFWAALFGIPLPLCSCAVLPTAVSLRKQGAARGATVSFLISTPESGIDSIAITYALIDPLMTIFRPLAAFITAFTAGIIENFFSEKEGKEGREEEICIFCEEENSHAHVHKLSFKLKRGFHYAFIDLLADIAKWLLIGIVIAGIISYLIPQRIIENYLGYGWQAMFLILILSIPLYICATASTPIASALILKGMSPGVALVFLLTGPATNIASLTVISKFLGKRATLVYLVTICVSAIILGIVLNYIYLFFAIDIKATIGKAGEVIPHYLKLFSAILLLFLMIRSMIHNKVKKSHQIK